MSRHLVFTYGTLKRGQPNDYLMKNLKDVTFIGRAVICKQFPLVIGGPWKLPYLLKIEGKGKNVKGDVFEVNDEALQRLDEFEDHPEWYERHLTDVELISSSDDQPVAPDSSRLTCWAYFCNIYDEADLNSPCYEDYDSYGSHGMEYDVSENEDHPSNKAKT